MEPNCATWKNALPYLILLFCLHAGTSTGSTECQSDPSTYLLANSYEQQALLNEKYVQFIAVDETNGFWYMANPSNEILKLD